MYPICTLYVPYSITAKLFHALFVLWKIEGYKRSPLRRRSGLPPGQICEAAWGRDGGFHDSEISYSCSSRSALCNFHVAISLGFCWISCLSLSWCMDWARIDVFFHRRSLWSGVIIDNGIVQHSSTLLLDIVGISYRSNKCVRNIYTHIYMYVCSAYKQ